MTTTKKINHLYWRAGFGLSAEEWSQKQSVRLDACINELFEQAKQKEQIFSTSVTLPNYSNSRLKSMSKKEQNELRKQGLKMVRQLNVEWVERMGNPAESALLEKMTLFWHGHFACVTKTPELAFRQLSTIRKNALGSFRSLLHDMSRDVSMIRFLNNQQNKKRSPNENFARELMELFTIGRGHYTEQDIKEAARAFTGWSGDYQGDFIFRKRQHDFGEKTFMGKTGTFGGRDIIEMILSRPETALFVTRKIYRFFVNEQVDEKRVITLANYFFETDYNITLLMRRIFESDWFYDQQNVGTRIKSPVELLAGMTRQLQLHFDEVKSSLFIQKALGQILFNPPNVAGWKGGKAWIDNSTLMIRLNLVTYLVLGTDVDLRTKDEFEAIKRGFRFKKINGQVDISPIQEKFDYVENRQKTFDQLKAFLIVPKTDHTKSFFDPFVVQESNTDYIKSLMIRLMSLPEYQLC